MGSYVSKASSSGAGGGAKLFNSIMSESVRGRTNTADVLSRMDAYSRVAKTRDENLRIWKTELPELYDEFTKNETEYNKLLDIVYGKATDAQRARYSELSDRRVDLGNYIRSGEKYLRDQGESKLADELEKRRKAMGISTRDLYA